MGLKQSRAYLERTWLPRLGAHPPVLDIGKRAYTADYAGWTGTSDYLSVDRDPEQSPDIIADVTRPEFVELARARREAYGAILCNGVIGHGVDSPAQVRACTRHFAALLRPEGRLLVGWNEWTIDRGTLFAALTDAGLRNHPIEGRAVFEPEESPGYEYLRHYYTLWLRP